jgi:hypothetical protein
MTVSISAETDFADAILKVVRVEFNMSIAMLATRGDKVCLVAHVKSLFYETIQMPSEFV